MRPAPAARETFPTIALEAPGSATAIDLRLRSGDERRQAIDTDVVGNHRLRLRLELRLRTMLTPGHTPGSMCFDLEGSPVLLSGDTLFPGGPGATSFEGGDFDTIIRSIDDRLFSRLPDDTIVMPGHGDDTTIGAERPHLQEWVDRGW